MKSCRVIAVALGLCALSVVVQGVARPKRTPDPPTVAEHIEWHRTRRDGSRPTIQLVGVIDEAGVLTWHAQPMPGKRRGHEPFHVRIIRPSPNGIAYYAWKTGKIDAFTTADGRLVVQPARRRPFWRRLI